MKTTRFIPVAVIGLAGLFAGCASTGAAQGQPATTTQAAPVPKPGPGTGMMGETCPMHVPGTTVTSTDVEGGVALAFTTSTGDAAGLRQRVQRMAAMHNSHHGSGGMMTGGDAASNAVAGHDHRAAAGPGHEAGGRGGMMMGGKMSMPAATASAEDIAGGGRLILRPKAPAELETLREHARTRAGRMAGGECPMMSHGTKGHGAAPLSAGDADHKKHHPSAQGN